MQRIARILIGLALVVAATMVVHRLILGGTLVKLKAGTTMSGVVSQSLVGSNNDSDALPAVGKDYTIDSIRYFDDSNWAVASITQTGGSQNSALLILQREKGMYQPMLGPGTAFSSSYLQSLPSDLGKYLNSKGVVYEPGS